MEDYQRTVNIYNQYVQEYANRFMDLQLYKDTFDYLLDVIPEKGTIFELGCGPGNVIKYLRSKRPDLVCFGIDLAPEMVKEAERQNSGSRFEVMDIHHIGTLKQKFSAIVASFCLPYVSSHEVAIMFRNINRLLETNGLLYLSFMEGARDRSGFERTSFTGSDEIYINYYERTEIENVLQAHTFDIEAFYTKDYPESDGTTTIDLIYIARKINVS